MAAGMFVLGPSGARAQEQALFPNTPQAMAPQGQGNTESTSPVDPTLTTHETAVECALAKIVEDAGQRHLSMGNSLTTIYQAGLCSGKIQTYILAAQAQNPSCFPRISMEEGINIFVKWAEANLNQGGALYLDGFKAAFEESVPCMKKP